MRTLLLFIVIAAMATALAAQEQQYRLREMELISRYEAELTARVQRQTSQQVNMLNEREKLLAEREAELSRQWQRFGIRCRVE